MKKELKTKIIFALSYFMIAWVAIEVNSILFAIFLGIIYGVFLGAIKKTG
jgi:hypothetical protein